MPQVEWDFDAGVALAIREDEDGPTRVTGAARDTSHRIEWVPLVWEYPEDYLPRFPRLLGDKSRYEYDAANNRVLGFFLEADYSVAAVRQALKDEVAREMAQKLIETDWMAIEAMETGEPLDPTVQSERAQIRGRMRAIEAQISNAPANKLPDFAWPPLHLDDVRGQQG